MTSGRHTNPGKLPVKVVSKSVETLVWQSGMLISCQDNGAIKSTVGPMRQLISSLTAFSEVDRFMSESVQLQQSRSVLWKSQIALHIIAYQFVACISIPIGAIVSH